MQRYQSHKIVEAEEITFIDLYADGHAGLRGRDDVLIATVTKEYVTKYDPKVGGYYVKYSDGYESWSPAEAFEEGYDLLQPSSGKSKIAGYRELTETEIESMNEIKNIGKKFGEFIDAMRTHEEFDQRWVALGATDLQKGLMSLTRAIAKPEFF